MTKMYSTHTNTQNKRINVTLRKNKKQLSASKSNKPQKVKSTGKFIGHGIDVFPFKIQG